MKKRVLLVFGFCFSFLFSFSQTYILDWARCAKLSLTGAAEGGFVAVDHSKNVYLAGDNLDTIIFGSYTLAHGGSYLAKYDSQGNLEWAKSDSGFPIAYSGPSSVCVDAAGNSYLAGGFDDTVYFDSFRLIDKGFGDMYLVKRDSMGNVLWAKSYGTDSSSDYATGVTTDLNGNIYIAGTFGYTSIIFGSDTLYNAVWAYSVFLVKLDSSGNVLWARNSQSTVDDLGYSVATDSWGNIFVTGYFESPSISFGSYTLTNNGHYNIFLAKYDSSGNALWAKSAGGTGYDGGYTVAADLRGNAIIAGFFDSPSISFGSNTLSNSGGGNFDGFIAKYDSSGNVLWSKGIGGTDEDYCWSVTTDKHNNIFLTGGFLSSSVDVGGVTLNGFGTDPMYIVKYDSTGHVLFAKAVASGGDDENSIALDISGCIYIGGDFAIDPFILGNDTLPLTGMTGTENAFVSKLCYSGIIADFTSSATNICAEGNNCINFSDFSSGNPTSWQWHFTGASPDTSSQQNPTHICYSSAGTYAVTLIVTNASGSDTLTVSPMITVGGAPAPPIITIVGDTLFSSRASSYQWYLNGNIISGATDSFYVWNQGGTYSVGITDSIGCSALSGGVPVAVQEINGGGGVEVYPNPVSQSAVISLQSAFRGNIEITVVNVLGKNVYGWQHQTLNSKLQTILDVSYLPNGVYFLKIDSGERTVNKKFVVLH